jgi:hypothetical protein
MIDLYRLVREAIRTSEPAYSIKNMEKIYLDDARGGEVTTAGDSIVMYERWRRLRRKCCGTLAGLRTTPPFHWAPLADCAKYGRNDTSTKNNLHNSYAGEMRQK